MSLLNFFIPQRIKFPDSRYNINISVLGYLTSKTLAVDGLIESGDIMTKIWKKALTTFIPRSFKPKRVLLLGLAGGCNAHLVNKYYPEASITAVEIDPFMVELGQKYFNLNKVHHLDIVITDALAYVKKLKPKDQFDLTMVDCFVGKEIPKKLEDVDFLKKLKSHSRFVLINRLWWREGRAITLNFFRTLAPHQFFIKARSASNVVISLV